MAKNFSPPPGVSDILPEETSLWLEIEAAARRVLPLYGYGEIRTPIFEYTEVFTRGIGDETDVVKKEMYTFEDRGGRSLTLRPEGTAGVMRALAAAGIDTGGERRVFYMGPMFRGERPAAGRRRQFHQIGVENVGRRAPGLDAECIAMLQHFLTELGINDARLLLNTRGEAADRGVAAERLREFFRAQLADLCPDCGERLERNVWRILDCKVARCRQIADGAPPFLEVFSDSSRRYFDEVCAMLEDAGVPFERAPKLVRGLDYYQHTVFEIVHHALGGQDALAGGGRYELYLPGAEKPLIGVGFALGVERLLMAREKLGIAAAESAKPAIFLVGFGDEARRLNFRTAAAARRRGIAALVEFEDKSVKAQMRAANRSGARLVAVRGDNEIAADNISVKNMASGEQEAMSEERLLELAAE